MNFPNYTQNYTPKKGKHSIAPYNIWPQLKLRKIPIPKRTATTIWAFIEVFFHVTEVTLPMGH